MLNSKFNKILRFIQNKNVLVLTHQLVDIDALACFICFKYLISKLKYNRVYFHISTPTKSTKEFFSLWSEKFGINKIIEDLPYPSEIDALIVLDTNNLDHIIVPDSETNDLKTKPIIFIDHHSIPTLNKEDYNMLSIIDDRFNSTSEIIYELIKHYNFKIPIPYIYLIVAGIITDTSFFKHANKEVFQRLGFLLENDVNYQEIVDLLDHEITFSEKIAQIKGVQRVQLYRMGDRLVGISHVSNFRARIAANLLNLGFDVSIVYSKLKKGNYITARAKKYVCLETGLHLGKLLGQISNGKGGGHDGAATVFIETSIEDKLAELIELIQEILIK